VALMMSLLKQLNIVYREYLDPSLSIGESRKTATITHNSFNWLTMTPIKTLLNTPHVLFPLKPHYLTIKIQNLKNALVLKNVNKLTLPLLFFSVPLHNNDVAFSMSACL